MGVGRGDFDDRRELASHRTVFPPMSPSRSRDPSTVRHPLALREA